MHKIGAALTSRILVGPKELSRIMNGPHKIYPNNSLAITASLAFEAAGGSLDLSIQVEDGQPWSISGLPAGWTASATSGSGSDSVTVTASNNTSTDAKGGTITVISEDLTAECSVSQAAGAIAYGDWSNVALIADDYTFGPTGGTTAAYVQVARVWTWNGVPDSGDVETTTSSLAAAAGYPSWISASANSLTCPSLGTTPRAESTYVIECQSALAANRVSATLTQAANYIVEQQIMPGTLQFTPNYVDREEGGVAVCRTVYTTTWEWKYSTGDTSQTPPPASYGTVSSTSIFRGNPGVSGAYVDPGSGNVTWDAKTSSMGRTVNVIREVTKTLTPNTAAYPGAPTLTASQTYQGVSKQY